MSVVGSEADDRAAALRLTPVSRETEERLALLVDLLRRWQRIKNLVGPGTLPQVWTRHVADSAQLVRLAPQARIWADMGSGAGFPGLVIAILLREMPKACIHLIESNFRKCAFLREVVRETGAPAIVHPARIEDILPHLPPIAIVTARALAPLPQLIVWAKRLIDAGSTGLFLKGAEAEHESATISPDLAVNVTLHQSLTHRSGRIVEVRSAERHTVRSRDAEGGRADGR